MNERLTTAIGVLVALALIVGIFVQPPDAPTVTRPTSAESGSNGYQGLLRWLGGAGIPVASLQERYDRLAAIAPAGSVLITTVPHKRKVRPDEIQHLMDWVESGNTLIVLAALDDTPDWSQDSDTSTLIQDIERLSGVTFEAGTDEAGEILLIGSGGGQASVEFTAEALSHPLNDGVTRVVGWTDSTTSLWQPGAESASPGSAFLREVSTGFDAAWTKPRGFGHIVTIAAGSLFSNRALGESDNRLLFANLIRWHLSGTGKFIFDDLHQGLSTLYDPEAFYADSRVGVTVLFVVAFWFVYMIGTQNRLLPLRISTQFPQQGDFVKAMGGFLARKLRPDATARLMFERWFEELRRRGNLPLHGSPWTHLEASPLIDGEALTALRQLHARAESGAKIDLSQLHNSIQRIREALG